MIFTALDYCNLHQICFLLDESGKPTWPGYRPEVIEIPNGDGKADTAKRYAHVKGEHINDEPEGIVRKTLRLAFDCAYEAAMSAAIAKGIPSQYWPDYDASALRVLEYPPGAGSEMHTDFDLLTVNCYRSDGGALVYTDPPSDYEAVHMGELADLITGLDLAVRHEVRASTFRSQYSIVFFALPSPTAVLPDGTLVGDWLAERYARSRGYK